MQEIHKSVGQSKNGKNLHKEIEKLKQMTGLLDLSEDINEFNIPLNFLEIA